MGWRNLPDWIKGGIIALVIWLGFLLIGFLLLFFDSSIALTIGDFLILISILPVSLLSNIFSLSFMTTGLDALNRPNYLGWVVIFIIYFVIGALIGFIYSKIKRKGNIIIPKTTM